ncbi:MAG: GAF domain-containing protein [Candidatus Rokuibacteriota bacterium]
MTAAHLGREERARLLTVLRRILEAIGPGGDEREIFDVLVRESARYLSYAWVSVVLGDLEQRTARVLASVPSGAGPFRVGKRVHPPSGVWDAIQTGSPFVRESLERGSPLWEDAWLREQGIVAYVALPLRLRAKVIGTFNVGSREATGFTARVGLLTQLTEFAANAVLAARLIAETQHGLTRLRDKAAIPLVLDL